MATYCRPLLRSSSAAATALGKPSTSNIATLPLAGVFFQDFVWIGVAMLLVLGLPNAVAAALLLRRSGRQYVVTLVCAILLLAWTGFEMVYMFNVGAVGFFAVGVVSLACSIWLLKTLPPSER